jgi:hypothetical protein
MATLATPAPHPAPLSTASDASDIDDLVSRFVEAEEAAATAYREAYLLDVEHERLKNRLLELVQECGIPGANPSQRKLQVGEFELRVTLAKSSRVDPIAVRRFRYGLIKDGRGRHGRAAEIFSAEMTYSILPCAREILAGMRLSGELLRLLEQCEIVSEAPILDVSRIATE